MTREVVTDTYHIPEPVKRFDYWVLWDFDAKQPLAPWETGNCYPCKWGQGGDTNPRTNFNQARAAADLGARHLHDCYPFPDGPPDRVEPTLLLPHDGDDTPGPTPDDPPLLFIDYDDVTADGRVTAEAWDLAASIGGPLFVSRSAVIGEDPAGLHQLARGALPPGVTAFENALDTRGSVEIYYRSRMTGFTWQHVRGTPTDALPNATDAVADAVDTYGEPSDRRAPTDERDPPPAVTVDPDELPEDTTDDIDHVFAAIRHVGPSDISLRSTLTEDDGDRKSWDPSFDTSKSGTRLGYDHLNGGGSWIWRQGSHPVDALQVVAAEEGIIRDVTDYPEGEDFWRAVDALRERGANIPYFKGANGAHPDVLRVHAEPRGPNESRRAVIRRLRAGKRGLFSE